jgi:hydrogenase nickel incorporation protein HypB
MEIPIQTRIHRANEQVARQVRRQLTGLGLLSVNVMASPGAGKSSLILSSARGLPGPSAVIEGDVAGRIDADLMAEHGLPVVQINTGGGCHLDAAMVREALSDLPLEGVTYLWIENVGNLICPVGYDLGTNTKVAVASVPEGHDKPRKYPAVFAQSDAVLLNKIDLADLLEFDRDAFRQAVRALAPEVPIFELSAKTGYGMEPWLAWLQARQLSLQEGLELG